MSLAVHPLDKDHKDEEDCVYWHHHDEDAGQGLLLELFLEMGVPALASLEELVSLPVEDDVVASETAVEPAIFMPDETRDETEKSHADLGPASRDNVPAEKVSSMLLPPAGSSQDPNEAAACPPSEPPSHLPAAEPSSSSGSGSLSTEELAALGRIAADPVQAAIFQRALIYFAQQVGAAPSAPVTVPLRPPPRPYADRRRAGDLLDGVSEGEEEEDEVEEKEEEERENEAEEEEKEQKAPASLSLHSWMRVHSPFQVRKVYVITEVEERDVEPAESALLKPILMGRLPEGAPRAKWQCPAGQASAALF